MYKTRFDLTGKVALITGGTGRLGSELSKGFAEFGANVLLVSRDEAKQEALATEIRGAGGQCDHLACDLSDLEAVDKLARELVAQRRRVDIIVQNATDPASESTVQTTTEAQFEASNRVIFKSAWILFRNLCPAMVAAQGGSIVSVISSVGFIPQRGLFSYGMAKAALMHLTKFVAQEYGPKVRANCITPGTIDTTGKMADIPIVKQTLTRVSAGRLGHSDECVGPALFLASDAASYVSGQVYLIDGGRF